MLYNSNNKYKNSTLTTQKRPNAIAKTHKKKGENKKKPIWLMEKFCG